ncbi:MAG: molybdate transporter periplasmic protein [Alphaproteobacteria bacterium]|nr:molybdate transporter periplasmic protein [Alphaproteobacteria bacterium]
MRLPTLIFALTLLAGSAQAGEIRIISPGLIYNAALDQLAADYKKQTGNTVINIHGTMDKIIGQAKTDTPPADIVGLPTDLMNTLVLDGGIVPGSYTLLGRGELALAVKKGAPHPDISTIDKLAAVLKHASAVMINDPKGGTMQGILIDGLLKRPEFAGVHVVPSSRGEGAAALARGEGEMAIQLVQEILNKPEIELVAPLPVELGGHMDAVLAVSARSADPKMALDFIRFLTRPEARAAWTAKGMKPF